MPAVQQQILILHMTPQQMTEALRQVTRAQIAEAAKMLQPDSVFILRAEREEAEDDAD